MPRIPPVLQLLQDTPDMLRSVARGSGTPKPTVEIMISSSGAFGQIAGYSYAVGYLITGCCLALLGQVATNMVSSRMRANGVHTAAANPCMFSVNTTLRR